MVSKYLTEKELLNIKNSTELLDALEKNNYNCKDIVDKIEYEQNLRNLQIELVNLQRWVINNKKRIIIIFEGRDASGKGGSIRRYMEHMNPRFVRLVALNKPTDIEKGQWYFQRYITHLPNPGEIVLFDRSWYNRAVVEPVMGFCSNKEYSMYIRQVTEFEHMLYEDGIELIKFWFSITKQEQYKRFSSRIKHPLKRWKLSPVDKKGQELWDDYTKYKNEMFTKTHTSFSPWIIVSTDDKKQARSESIRYVLSNFKYVDNKNTIIAPDPNIVMRYHRSVIS